MLQSFILGLAALLSFVLPGVADRIQQYVRPNTAPAITVVTPTAGGQLGYSVATGYKTTLSSSMTSVQNYVPVSSMKLRDGSTLTTSTLGGKVYLVLEPGSVREEIVKCTGSSATQWTNCTRGLPFSGTSEVSSSTLAKAHNAGTTVVMSDVHYVFEQFADINDKDQTIGGAKSFTGQTAFTYFPTVSSSTAIPTSNNQLTSWYAAQTLVAGGFSSLNVSTTRGLSVDGTAPEKVGINASSTTGMSFDSNGKLYQKTSSTLAIESDNNGIKINTSTLIGLIATSTPIANKVAVSDTSSTLDSWVSKTNVFGKGTDGSYVLDGTQGTVVGLFTRNSSTSYTLLKDAQFINLTINSGVTLETNGFIIYGTGSLVNNGTIQNNGGPGGDASGITPGIAGTSTPANTLASSTPGRPGGAGCGPSGDCIGSAGGNGLTSTIALGSNGVAGGVGGGDSFGNMGGGPGSAGVVVSAESLVYVLPFFNTVITSGSELSSFFALRAKATSSSYTLSTSAGSGSGGGGRVQNPSTNGISGGGGGSGATGGPVEINFAMISNNGTIQSLGGKGGRGGNGTADTGCSGGGGGGGGGNGGIIAMAYSYYFDSGLVTTTPGSAGLAGVSSGSCFAPGPGNDGVAGKVYRIRL